VSWWCSCGWQEGRSPRSTDNQGCLTHDHRASSNRSEAIEKATESQSDPSSADNPESAKNHHSADNRYSAETGTQARRRVTKKRQPPTREAA